MGVLRVHVFVSAEFEDVRECGECELVIGSWLCWW